MVVYLPQQYYLFFLKLYLITENMPESFDLISKNNCFLGNLNIKLM